MANPNTEVLTQWSDVPNADGNTPADGATMDITSPTSLPAELREIKGVVRQLSIDRTTHGPGAGWVDYTDLVDFDNGGSPVRTGNNSLSLTGDWTTIALVGRKIRVIFADGSTPIVSTILTSVAVGSPATTTLTLTASILGTGAAVSAVEYSVVGSGLANASNGYPLDVVANPAGTDFMLSPSQGGTGKTDGTASPSGLASGDLIGSYPGPQVTGLGGFALDLSDPNALAQRALLLWDKTNLFWTPATVATALASMTALQSQSFMRQALTSLLAPQGWIKIPIQDGNLGATTVIVQWTVQAANANPTQAVTLPIPFPTKLVFALGSATGTSQLVWASWDGDTTIVAPTVVTLNVAFQNPTTANLFVLAIGY